MPTLTPTIFVVDDDASVRKSLQRLLTVCGYRVQTFASAREFLQARPGDTPACLVLDIRLSGLNGLELQQALAAAGRALPIVFITGHGDIPMSVQAMKAGAVDFLPKPFTEQALLGAIEEALAKSRREGAAHSELAGIKARLATLSPREAEVFRQVVAGRLNKEIAAEFGIAEQTVKIHRGRVMDKLQVQSVADLARLAEKAGIAPK